jgi:cdd4
MNITFNNVNKKYGRKQVLQDINITIPEGKIYGFIGANGAGKTTAMKILTGLTPASSGTVTFDGKELNQLENRAKAFGAFISTPTYYENLTAYENLAIIQDVLEESKDEIDRVLEIVGLTDAKNKTIAEYSFGMKQRLGLAFSFLNDPDILILDEPTNGLDPKGIVEIRELLYSLSKEQGKTIFISSHNISELESIADMIGIIQNGQLIFEGELDELYASGESSYLLEIDDIDQAKKMLSEEGISFTNKEHKFQIKSSKQYIPEIVKALLDRDIDIFEITPNKNLERIFLDLTDGDDGHVDTY